MFFKRLNVRRAHGCSPTFESQATIVSLFSSVVVSGKLGADSLRTGSVQMAMGQKHVTVENYNGYNRAVSIPKKVTSGFDSQPNTTPLLF